MTCSFLSQLLPRRWVPLFFSPIVDTLPFNRHGCTIRFIVEWYPWLARERRAKSYTSRSRYANQLCIEEATHLHDELCK